MFSQPLKYASSSNSIFLLLATGLNLYLVALTYFKSLLLALKTNFIYICSGLSW